MEKTKIPACKASAEFLSVCQHKLARCLNEAISEVDLPALSELPLLMSHRAQKNRLCKVMFKLEKP